MKTNVLIAAVALALPFATFAQSAANADKAKPAPKSAAAKPAAKASKPAKPAHRTHKVRKGDTLSAIGQKYGVSWQEIARVNHIKNPDLIFPGQKFIIPQD